MLFQQIISTLPFKQWLKEDKENKRLFWFAVAAMVISFGWLKIVYPYPNFMPPDSDNYLEAANRNDFINIWPIGYSKFLQLVGVFTRSHIVLVVLQYLLLQTGVLYFLFTIRYLLSPSKWMFRILMAISILNPLLPHISNFVSSDCLFASLSLIWFTQLLWIIYRPNKELLLTHAIVLLFCFMVRHNALYYPFISIGIIIIKHMPRNTKWLGIGSISFLLLFFIGRTQYEYKLKTDTVQYSAFGGWQLGANALYGYAYASPIDPINVNQYFRPLHKLVNRHMDSLRRLRNRPDTKLDVYYLWNFKSPLRLYMEEKWGLNNSIPFFKQWASMGPLYQEYGRYLIGRYPWLFIKHYIWPNLLRYYAPPTGFMEQYNMGNKTVSPIAISWFNWKNNQLPIRTKDNHISIISIFPNLLAIVNPLFFLSSTIFLFFRGTRKCNRISNKIIACILMVLYGNAIFSVLSAPIELRYQVFPIVITMPFTVFFISWIIQSLQSAPTTKSKQKKSLPEPAM